ncbi:OsmC family protein [Segniliparus rotundus DSM 44985]|uniref:OsmC family protein n=1 Tax=Segniliparus rotundus (strain ATCC BAA-972 / CDC 1076 / CIP 108378 / DSM 44985 / JCM 13578) TaxID=640132 RepID=D6ZE69_SEGRD|nr:OsmC family protein [Segniliparus rotundus]ADG97349.1 OsmC family protein [Segniliparus rotundus DSM 44985]
MTGLHVRRVGTRRYTGHNDRGGEVQIGSHGVDGTFTPGELLKIALAACTGLSSDAPLARRLGDDYAAVVEVCGDADREREVYPVLREELRVDLSALSEEERERVLLVVAKAVDQVCTVGRTLKQGAQVEVDIVNTTTGSL